MTKKIDPEVMIFLIADHAKAIINSKITAINEEKDDGITLDEIKDSAWFFQSLDDGNHNFDPFILYFIDDMTANGAGNQIARKIVLEFDIFLINDQNENFQRKILRYQRALEETLLSAWGKVGPTYALEVQALTPIDVKMQNSTNAHKVFGVTIEFEIA